MQFIIFRLIYIFGLFIYLQINVFAQPFIWSNIGYPFTTSAPYQGSTLDSAGNVYVAMEYSGLFRSTNLGQDWNHSYFAEDYIFELISDRDGFTYVGVNGIGVIRTSDGGTTWDIKNEGLADHWAIYAFGLMNGNTLLAATYPLTLYSSTNHGDSWNILPDISHLATAVGCIFQGKSGDIFMGTLDSGLFRSSDECKTWKRINYFSNRSRIPDIASLPDGTIIVPAQFDGVFSSTDNGNTWKDILHTRFNFFSSVGTFADSTIICNDAVGGIYRSNNSGRDWEYLGLENVAIRSMICAPNGDVYAFPAGSIPGVMRHDQSFWTLLQIPNLSIICMTAHDTSIMVGSETSVHYLSIDGSSYTGQSIRGSATHELLFTKKGVLFGGNYADGIWKTKRQSYSYLWVSCPTPISGGYSCFSLAENANGILYAGTGNDFFSDEKGSVFSSSDEGVTWNEHRYNLPVGSVNKLLSTKKNTIIASVAYNGIYRLKETDTVWMQASGFPMSNIGIMEALAQDSVGNIYCGTEKYGIYISTNDGETWSQSSGSTSMNRVTDILVLPNSTVLATTKSGVYTSLDKGGTWNIQSTNITSHYTWAATIDSKGYVYIGTYGAGIFKSDSPITSVESSDKLLFNKYQLLQNYPNPFNPSTTISFEIPSSSAVSLKIYDALGREVSTIVSEELHAGRYERNWTAKGMPTGVYFYRLKTNGYSETKKLLLIK